MSLENAKKHLAKYDKADDIMEFDTSSATVELAAIAIGCEPVRIFKTPSFAVGDRVALIVCAGGARIANPNFKERFNTKAKISSKPLSQFSPMALSVTHSQSHHSNG